MWYTAQQLTLLSLQVRMKLPFFARVAIAVDLFVFQRSTKLIIIPLRTRPRMATPARMRYGNMIANSICMFSICWLAIGIVSNSRLFVNFAGQNCSTQNNCSHRLDSRKLALGFSMLSASWDLSPSLRQSTSFGLSASFSFVSNHTKGRNALSQCQRRRDGMYVDFLAAFRGVFQEFEIVLLTNSVILKEIIS